MHDFSVYTVITFTRDDVHDIVEPHVLGVFTDLEFAVGVAIEFRETAKCEGKNVCVTVKASVLTTDKFMV